VTAVSPARAAALRDGVFARCFAPSEPGPGRVGAEVEFLAHDETGRPVPLGGDHGLVARIDRYAARASWTRAPGYGAVPRFETPAGAVISFEPGGQVEISTPACAGASALVRALSSVVQPLRSALADEGVSLRSLGIDSRNDARSIPLQLPAPRYERMTEYFESIGPFGIRMMRQTAAIQISLDRGDAPADRWRLLNDLAPYLIAMFANSPRYLGAETGHRSYRAHCWRMLDPTRTGVAVPQDDPAAAYTSFALAANDMMRRDADGRYRPFGEWALDGDADARWEEHLTTLFPEVRPRGHFEVRSCDAIDPAWYGVPMVLLCGLVYDARAAVEASVLASDSRVLLRTAGEHGLRDAGIARTARDLFHLAIDGARRLGPEYVTSADLDVARQYYTDYTARGRSPADDVRPAEGNDEPLATRPGADAPADASLRSS